VHAAAALVHHFRDRDDVLRRMLPGGRPARPPSAGESRDSSESIAHP